MFQKYMKNFAYIGEIITAYTVSYTLHFNMGLINEYKMFIE